jgi:aminoglycoside phosphotransferase (APT) family kinase protein
MAIIQQRDPEAAKRALTIWLADRMPDARGVEIHVSGASEASGFSSDTIIFDATWTESGAAKRQGFVVRAAPMGEAVFRTYEMGLQFDILRALKDSDVPVPRVFWMEESSELLGAPFFAMERLQGRVPADNLPYTYDGWLLEASPDEQRTAWIDGIDTLTKIAAIDWKAAGLVALDRTDYGEAPGEQLFAWQREYYEWAARKRVDCLEYAWTWLDANRPNDDHLAAFSWGDARIGNLLFGEDYHVRAVFDWEMARIGNPEFDLAWYLWFDKHFSAGVGAPRLPGFPSDADMIARWEERMGRRAENLEWYTVFTMVFFAGIMMRVVQSNIAHGANPDELGPMETNNPCLQLLAAHFGLPAPG